MRWTRAGGDGDGDGYGDGGDGGDRAAIRMTEPLLSVRDLSVRYGDSSAATVDAGAVATAGENNIAPVVDNLSFDLFPGEALAMVGESGSGKSQTWLAALGLLDAGASVAGSVRYRGRDLLTLPRRSLDQLRGRDLALIFQDPMTALNPSMRLGAQLTEAPRRHRGLSAAEARARAADMLRTVGVPDAAQRLRAYPHELSGGLRQRAAFAMALLCEPKILIADEPTTALDATVQAQILRLLADLRRRFSLTLAIVTHDLGVVAALCDRMLVMYGGREMESGPVDEVFAAPRHPYTAGLLAATPRLDRAVEAGGKLPMIPGAPPAPGELPADSCPFAPRCPKRIEVCTARRPRPETVAPGRRVACHLHANAGDGNSTAAPTAAPS
ncbi:MAG: ABC transporter ATP-binding protein [Gammaproteobacteria bacterium]|nr:ABC transporter ATP-binding protein [Gammaproteobacteria bacterium]